MSKLEGREISYVKLHGGDAFVNVPDIGALGTTLPPTNKTLALKMVHTTEGVYVNINNSKAEIMVPWANVQTCTYKPVEAAK